MVRQLIRSIGMLLSDRKIELCMTVKLPRQENNNKKDCRIVIARIVYLAVFGLLLERSAPQPVSSQMFHACGER